MTAASSYALIVRDAMMTRVKAMAWFNGFKFGTNKALQIQPEHVPFVGVYFINEDLTPDGDADHGEPRFRSSALYGFSIIVQNNDAAESENVLDSLWNQTIEKLLTDPSLYLNPAAQIQAYVRGNRSHQFGSVGADNATPIAESRFTLICDLGTIDFPPAIIDPLNTIHVTTDYPAGSDPDEVQQIEAEYDLPQNLRSNGNEGTAKKRRRSPRPKTSARKGIPERGTG